MIKGLFIDFDGTLCNLVEVHYIALNEAISKIAGNNFIISREEQNQIYNGLSTKTKLDLLVSRKKLPKEFINEIASLKQELTIEAIKKEVKPNLKLKEDLTKLKQEGYKLYCVSNALLVTVTLGLQLLEIYDLFDHVIGNDFIKKQKPDPLIYLKAFVHAELDPKECLVIEDSKHGREAGYRSGAYVCTVDNETQTTYEYIKSIISIYNKPRKIPWKDNRLNVIIPCAGIGSRFAEVGYKLPKPLIDVNGKPMIQVVVENLNIEANFIFVVQKKHYELYNLGILLSLIYPGCKIVQSEGLTEGAACTTLLAKEYINNDDHLLIANSDQFLEWNSSDFMYDMVSNKVDGGLLVFKDEERNPKWSFSKINEFGKVTEVAEKKPISDLANTGVYYFNKGSEYVQFAEQMIEKNIRTFNEFFICPVFNEYIKSRKKIKTYNCDKMLGLGTPSDLSDFLETYKI